MGAGIKDQGVQDELRKLKEDTAKAEMDLKLDLAQAAIDAAGVVDPTPISDAIGAVMSAARGDWIGAGLSVVSMIPYAGDAVGKTAKGAKLAAKMLALRRQIAGNALAARQVIFNALKKDAAAIRAKRAAEKGQRIADAIVEGCPVGGNRFGTQTPKEGWIRGSERGHGSWDPRQSGLNKDRIDDIESVTKGEQIPFKDGYPDYSKYVHKAKAADGAEVPARVEIELSRTGDREKDFAKAREAMAEKLGVDQFHEPRGWTWHHAEDGTTMQLVPSKLHNNVPHSGGVSLAKDPSY